MTGGMQSETKSRSAKSSAIMSLGPTATADQGMSVQISVALLIVVARALGHSTTKMTETHYAHLSPSFEASEIRRTAPRFGTAPDAVVTPFRKR
jgi:hypothetical protein